LLSSNGVIHDAKVRFFGAKQTCVGDPAFRLLARRCAADFGRYESIADIE